MDWDELGHRLEQIADTLGPDHRIGALRQLLDELPEGSEGRAEVLSNLADDLVGDGQLDAAEDTYQAAIDDGGRTVLTPQVGLLTIALARRDEGRVDELLTSLLARSRSDQLVVGDYEWIGESLEDAGRLRDALRWLTIPLRDIQPGDVDRLPILALDARYRVRRALDLPIDAYDDARDVWHEMDEARP